ncbi:MAG TPA: cysteine desulfurase-like protein [Candidatus Baltobacteraceae bacterium]|jgi:cysteine desulfurase family protein (TIGR01976 family)|nr:cysteine desulfurase-like protein [Candidatus Baltobacteraceae bacterium]
MQVESFPIAPVRQAFPALAIRDGNRPRVYLDNPAGTQVPETVADAIRRCLIETNANLGGYFTTSIAAGGIVADGYRAAADLLGAACEREIVVGPSMTALTFNLSRSLAHRIEPGDEIVVTKMDHDGNIAPWLAIAQERGAVVRWVPFDRSTWRIERAALADVLSAKTRVVALNYASNLTGSINDVAALCKLVRDAGALSYVDAVQFAPHGFVDVAALGCDFLACSPYKFFGPHLGIVWGREELLQRLHPYKVRPQADDSPAKFETGTPQIELFAGLTATVDYLAWLGAQTGASGNRRNRIRAAFEATVAYEAILARRLIDGLQRFDGISICGLTDPSDARSRVPTVSFTHARIASADVARAIARENVFVWSGHNFALEVVRSLGISEEDGVVRIGAAHYNTLEEIDTALDALKGALTA